MMMRKTEERTVKVGKARHKAAAAMSQPQCRVSLPRARYQLAASPWIGVLSEAEKSHKQEPDGDQNYLYCRRIYPIP